MEKADTGDAIQHPGTSCNCYRATSLTKTILNSTHVANFRDRYVLHEQLGWGQFGIIRACSDKLTGEILACKSISKDRLVTMDDVRSVKLEIEIMTKLSGHPNVVNLKAVYEEDNYVHLLMELCAGGELFHLLEKQGRFTESDARVIFRHLMQVVLYCHDNGIVHRDLKPENILLASKSSLSLIKLADFGLATHIKPGENLQGTVGSPFYIAPEVLAGAYNQAADLWSAGVILYILLSGMPPFWGTTKSRIFDAVRAADLQFPIDPWDQISPSAKDLISGMLCVDPSKRLNCAQVLAHSWMQAINLPQKSYNQFALDHVHAESLRSPSSQMFTRGQDLSFRLTSEGQRHGSSITSSFSSFLVDNSTPSCAFEDFSFINSDLSTKEFSPQATSISSFAFFTPSSMFEKGDASLEFQVITSNTDGICGETRTENIFELQDKPLPFEGRAQEKAQNVEFRREEIDGTTKVSIIQNRRNHTIELGELDQLNVVVTESVIRWASCTHIPSASSLRLSLVC